MKYRRRILCVPIRGASEARSFGFSAPRWRANHHETALFHDLDLLISVETYRRIPPAHWDARLVAATRRCDSRWLVARSDSRWYPNMRCSVRRPGDWAPVVKEIDRELVVSYTDRSARKLENETRVPPLAPAVSL